MISAERLLSHWGPGASAPDVITHAGIYAHTTDPPGTTWTSRLRWSLVGSTSCVLSYIIVGRIKHTSGDSHSRGHLEACARPVSSGLGHAPSPSLVPLCELTAVNHTVCATAEPCDPSSELWSLCWSRLQLDVSLLLCPDPKTAPLIPETILTTLSSPV